MLIPLNVTQGIADVLVSSSSSILVGRAAHCNTIGHCRTVWNIIWSCLITIFACIWVAVHPNIPQPKAPPKSRLQFVTDVCRGVGEKLAIALLALLAPEFIFVWALRQWLKARSIAKDCREVASLNVARERGARVREMRKQMRAAENDLVLAQQRADLEKLEALGFDKRTVEEDHWLETLRERPQATGKESNVQSTIEGSTGQTSAFLISPSLKSSLNSSIQHGKRLTDSSSLWAVSTSLTATNPASASSQTTLSA